MSYPPTLSSDARDNIMSSTMNMVRKPELEMPWSREAEQLVGLRATSKKQLALV
jgi:hypothetical protein